MAEIYLVEENLYGYSDNQYDHCDVFLGTQVIAAFTFFEMAQHYCNELNVNYYREKNIEFNAYIPYQGKLLFDNDYVKSIYDFKIEFSFDSYIKFRAQMKLLTDEEVLKLMNIIQLDFYSLKSVILYV